MLSIPRLALALALLTACKDPVGACEAPSGSIMACSDGEKRYCPGTFNQGKTCANLGYTQKSGVMLFKPVGSAR